MSPNPELRAVVAERLLGALITRGVRFTGRGDRLRYSAPPGALDAQLVAAIRAHKPELLALLSEELPTATAQNVDAVYLESVALTVEMCECCQGLADVSPPRDRAAWDAAHARYQAKANQVRAFGRTLDPAGRPAFHADLRARMYRIHDAWKAGQP